MTAETIAVIIVAAIFCCFLVYRWQEAAVDGGIAPEPYPVPEKLPTLEVETQLKAQAAWPFPVGKKPE